MAGQPSTHLSSAEAGQRAVSTGPALKRRLITLGGKPLGLALAALLAALVLPPLYYIVKTSLYTTEFDGSFGDFTFDNYRELFESNALIRHLLNSVQFAIGSAIIAITLGAALAWIVERTDAPMRKSMLLVSIVSLGVPHVLYTSAWLLILGKSGPINALLIASGVAAGPIVNPYGMGGMIVIEGMIWAPLGFLLLSSVFRTSDGSFEEAAMMCGADVGTTFRRITLGLATPALLALFLLVSIRAFEAFDIPALVGSAGGVAVLSNDIFNSIRKDIPSNFGQAGAFAIVLMIVVVALLALLRRLLRNAERYQTITGKGYRPRIIRLGALRYVATAFLVLCVFVLLVMPIAMILTTSFLPFYDGVSLDMFPRMTTANYGLVAHRASFQSAVVNTVAMGAATATFVCVLTAVSAWLAVRKASGGWLLDQLTTIPLIFPAIVLSVAFLQIFLNMPFPIYGTLISLVIATTVQYLPYGMRFCSAGALQIHRELEEAASTAGANRMQIFVRIVLPLIMPAIITSWLFVLLLSVRAVAMPILLSGPNSQVVAVALYDLWTNGQITELAALGALWAAFMMAIGLLFYRASQRYGLSVQ